MSSANHLPLIINLGNSIIGVSVLAMPYCFSQCGIVLGTLLLLGAAWLTTVSCTLLMRSALLTKRSSFEFLALHSYGVYGKLAVELSSIGLLIGTCIAFYVVIGDLGPAIISKVADVPNTTTLRSIILVVVAAIVVTPLGLLRDVESLNSISMASICFYILLVSTIVIRALPNIISGVWFNKVNFWRPEGMFQCLPIFAMAFGCQTQLFLMYNTLSEPSLKQMVTIVKGAVSLCTACYLSMGFFGYVAYCDSTIAGDILMNFVPSTFAEALKFGFVLSVAVSFPLVIFPCRASIQTLLFAPKSLHENVIGGAFMRVRGKYFRFITMCIIICTLCVGIAVPKIEFILSLTGSTMGSIICFVFPALIFLRVMPISADNSRLVAKMVLLLGVVLLFVSTFSTVQNASNKAAIEDVAPVQSQNIVRDAEKIKEVVEEKKIVKEVPKVDDVKDVPKAEEKRQEPPNPQAPIEEKNKESEAAKIDDKSKSEVKPTKSNKDAAKSIDLAKSVQKTKIEMDANLKKQKSILAELEKQQKQQKEILNEQKKVLAELKEHDLLHKSNKSNVDAPKVDSVVGKSPDGVEPPQQIKPPHDTAADAQLHKDKRGDVPVDSPAKRSDEVISVKNVPQNVGVNVKKVIPQKDVKTPKISETHDGDKQIHIPENDQRQNPQDLANVDKASERKVVADDRINTVVDPPETEPKPHEPVVDKSKIAVDNKDSETKISELLHKQKLIVDKIKADQHKQEEKDRKQASVLKDNVKSVVHQPETVNNDKPQSAVEKMPADVSVANQVPKQNEHGPQRDLKIQKVDQSANEDAVPNIHDNNINTNIDSSINIEAANPNPESKLSGNKPDAVAGGKSSVAENLPQKESVNINQRPEEVKASKIDIDAPNNLPKKGINDIDTQAEEKKEPAHHLRKRSVDSQAEVGGLREIKKLDSQGQVYLEDKVALPVIDRVGIMAKERK